MRKFIVLKTENRYQKIFLDDIFYCKAEGSYTLIYLAGGKTIVVAMLLKETERQLSGENFFRISRSHVVNLDHCFEILTNGSNELLLSNGKKLKVSRSRYKELVEQFCTHL
jgi:two-component system LytT family response regulator